MATFSNDGTENQMRWDRSSTGFMEVWYATVNHKASGNGLWLRYTLTAPDPRYGSPFCELWAFMFAESGPVFAAKQRYPIDQLGPPSGRDDGALLRIGNAWLSENHLEGEVADGDRMLTWSLDMTPSNRCFHHIPSRIRGRAEKKVSVVCSPNLHVPFSGSVKMDSEVFEFDEEPGCQSHRWGHAHANTWAWAHCSSFDEGPDALFEAVAAKSTIGLLPSPTLTFVYARLDGEDLVFNELKWALRAKSSYEMPTWAFSARNDDWKIVGASRVHPERLVQVTYMDPDSTLRYCANSEVADLALEVYGKKDGRWLHHRSLTASRTAHLEFGQREPFAELPVAF